MDAVRKASEKALDTVRKASGSWDWTPGAATVFHDLKRTVAEDDVRTLMKTFQDVDLGADPDPWFYGFNWVRFTGAH